MKALKTWIAAAAIAAASVATPAQADEDALQQISSQLEALFETRSQSWSKAQLARFSELRRKAELILVEDPYGAASEAWFTTSWILYGPDTYAKLAAAPVTLKIDRALWTAESIAPYFAAYLLSLDVCVAQTALAVQSGPARNKAQQELADAMPAILKMWQLGTWATSVRQAALLADETIDLAPALQAQLRSDIFANMMLDGGDETETKSAFYADLMTGELFTADQIDREYDWVVENYAAEIKAATPFYERLSQSMFGNPDALLAEICGS